MSKYLRTLLGATRAARPIVARRYQTEVPKGSTDFLERKEDLPSIKEFVAPHADNLRLKRDMKGMFTSDVRTIEIAKRVLEKDGTPFYINNIFSQPDKSTSELGSIDVLVSDIRDFPEMRRKFEQAHGKHTMVCVGGPAAEDQTVFAGIIDEVRERLDDIIYITRDYKESNVNHSAKQSHARHGNALNADERLTGHALLPKFILRKLLGVDIQETMDSEYIKIDIKDIDFTKLRIYFGNEINWLKQEYRKFKGELTEHDINRLESTLAQEILNVLEKKENLGIIGNVEELDDSLSIHVVFNEKSRRELVEENKDLAKVGIKSQELSPEEMEFFFGDSSDVYGAFKYHGDTYVAFDTHEVNRGLALKNGAKWLEGKEISRIFLTQNKEGKAELAGLQTKDGEYIYANRLHFTGGYKAKFTFDKESTLRFEGSFLRNLVNSVEDRLGLQNPLQNKITTSTGISINAIFRKSDRLREIIKKYGSTGSLAVTNSHWTMIAQDEDHIIMRITGGGNTGSEEYNPAYFLNVIANTRRIFGDDLVGVLSTYGCPRAVNARNSTEFTKFAEGAITSYGKGGTGNTKRQSEAVLGLMLLGFEEEVVKYFNQFQGRNSEPLGDKISEIHKLVDKVEFVHDTTERTNRRMGYDSSFSAEEKMAMAALLIAASYALKKMLDKKEESSSIVEIRDEDSITPSPTPGSATIDETQQKESSRI